MAFPSGSYLSEVGGRIRDEFESLYSLVQGWLGVEHKSDGTHADVTADTVTTTGTITVGTTLTTPDLTVTYDATITDDLAVLGDANVRARLSSGANATANTISITAPAGCTTGDVAVAVLKRDAVNIAADGWADNNGATPFTKDNTIDTDANDFLTSIFSRRLTGAEGASYTFIFTGDTTAAEILSIALCFSNPHATDIYDVAPSAATDNPEAADGGSIDAISINSTVNGSIHVIVGMRETTDFNNEPAGYTTDYGPLSTFQVAHKIIAVAGATGAATFTGAGNVSANTQSFLIKNNAGAAATCTGGMLLLGAGGC